MEHNRPCERRFFRQVPDYQQKDLYRAETRFMSDPPPAEAKFANGSEAQDWLKKLIASPELAAAYPHPAASLRQNPPKVKVGSATKHIGTAQIGDNVLRLSNALGGVGMTLPVMIHEVAHFVHSHTDGFAHGQEAHGPEFAAIYLDMVSLVCGEDQARRLSEDFKGECLRVAINSRRVSGGEGLLAGGKLPNPSGIRTAEQASDAALEHASKKMARAWKSNWKRANTWASSDPEKPEKLMREFAELNRGVFEEHLAEGGTIPEEAREYLGLPPAAPLISEPLQPAGPLFDDHVASTLQQAAAVRSGTESGLATRCGKRMPRAKRLCERPKGHRGPCK